MFNMMNAGRVGVALVFALSQGVMASDDANPAGTLYVCDEGIPYVQVLVPHDMNKNAVLMLESEQMEMAPMPMASGFGADAIVGPNHWMIQGNGPSELILLKDDDEPKQCNIVDVGNSQSERSSSNGDLVSAMGNFSLGGIVRSGPGMSYSKADSLPYGEPVVLLERTGEMMDNYEWFKIEYSEGLTGYQWGGIMCSNALHIVGLYEECPADLN